MAGPLNRLGKRLSLHIRPRKETFLLQLYDRVVGRQKRKYLKNILYKERYRDDIAFDGHLVGHRMDI